jgi:hemerythrin-like domain-containing protein
MNLVSLLSDDHSLLSSDVFRLVALVRAVAEGRFGKAHLQDEIRKQSNVLRAQLIEHFDFEESTAFPRLMSAIPAVETRLHRLIQEHDRILETFEVFRADLESDSSARVTETLLPEVLAFAHAFEKHANEETELFEQLSRTLEAG